MAAKKGFFAGLKDAYQQGFDEAKAKWDPPTEHPPTEASGEAAGAVTPDDCRTFFQHASLLSKLVASNLEQLAAMKFEEADVEGCEEAVELVAEAIVQSNKIPVLLKDAVDALQALGIEGLVVTDEALAEAAAEDAADENGEEDDLGGNEEAEGQEPDGLVEDGCECGACGAQVGEDEEACPKCGATLEDEPALCEKCGAEVDDDAKFCPKCGAAFESERAYCDKCGTQFLDDASFCSKCGTAR